MATAAKKAKAQPIGKKAQKAPVAAKLPTKVGSYVMKFAAVSAPVILYTAARDEKIELHHYHTKCKVQVKQLGNFCPACNGLPEKAGPDALDGELTLGKVRLPADEIFKGFDATEKIIPITDDDIDAAKPDGAQMLEILEFVDSDQVDPIAFDSSFYLAPDTGAGNSALKVYAMIRAAIEGMGKLAVARMVKSRREYIAFIGPYGDDGLILYTAFMQDEVRPMAFPELPVPNPAEVKAARSLINTMTAEWDPSKYQDNYRVNINAMIAARREGVTEPVIERKPVVSASDDLMSTLTASIELMKARKKSA